MGQSTSGLSDGRNGSGHDRRPAELTAAEQALTVGRPEAAPRLRVRPTRRSRWRFSRRATGLPWNLTFAEALEQISVGDSSRSQVTSIDRERVPAERRHPKAAYSRCRSTPAIEAGKNWTLNV